MKQNDLTEQGSALLLMPGSGDLVSVERPGCVLESVGVCRCKNETSDEQVQGFPFLSAIRGTVKDKIRDRIMPFAVSRMSIAPFLFEPVVSSFDLLLLVCACAESFHHLLVCFSFLDVF